MPKPKKWGVWNNPDDCCACRQRGYAPKWRGTLTPTGRLYPYEGYIPTDASEVWEWRCSTPDCMYHEEYSQGRKKDGSSMKDPMYTQPVSTKGLRPGPGDRIGQA